MQSGQPLLPEDAQQPAPDKPWLVAASANETHVRLTWDTTTHGSYVLAANDVIVSGKAPVRLVTLQSLTDAAFDYAESGFEIALGLVAAMVLFLGLMKVGEDAGIVQLVARVFYPIIRFLFPDVPKDHPANGAILMNWTTTILGLGNAATPFGLKAMQELQSLNPNKKIASDSQVMLLGYNTAGLALLPTTLLAVRKAAGCSDPFEIIGTCMLAGATATITAIIMVKLLSRLPIFTVQAALAEEAREQAATATPAEEGK
jgi:spore maturation protein A